ncbi:MAG TPA: CusA/CzcA family heavy metal efflux RND transporter [Candidatus Krumholzibacteria bacterium]|nr:CusA/CzcA family heavy metal efflux RND transporter [Candidatus Krumholzibacteria bacterium]
MIQRLVAFALHQRLLVCLFGVMLVVAGVWAALRLPIDAVPDITPVQVSINTRVTSFAPEEVERLVTYPLEVSMSGLPRLQFTRSLSRYGVSQITLQFKDGTDVYWARQLVAERLQSARDALPPGIAEPEMGPIASGLGEIYFYVIEPKPNSGLTLEDARTAQDWIVKPMLRSVPGVTEVATIGGYEQQIQVAPDLVRLRAYGLTLDDVARAVEAANANAGGGYIERNGEQVTVRAVGRAETTDDLAGAVIALRDNVAIKVSDVATVGIGRALRAGFAMRNEREAVLGSALMLMGENSREVAKRVEKRIEEVRASLPPGLEITPVYTRTTLVEETIHTVAMNLLHGGLLVFAVLFLTLGHPGAAIVVALAIPLSMMFAMIGMVKGGISGNLMSLGAIDFGLIVDGAVVMTENAVRRMGREHETLGRHLSREERRLTTLDACAEMGRPVAFAVAIIIIVYLPILALQGVEGRMFRPMAFTVILALVGSLLIALTLVPALVSLVVTGKGGAHESRFVRAAGRVYRPALTRALRRPLVTMLVALVPLVIAAFLFPRLGAVFLPRLEEGSIDVRVTKLPSAALSQSLAIDKQVIPILMRFPEVSGIFTHAGSADISTDPAAANDTDVMLTLRPRKQWKTAKDQSALAQAMEDSLGDHVAGCTYGFTQPIEDRFDDLLAGISGDVGVMIYGEDYDVLRRVAGQVQDVLRATPGSQGVRFDMGSTAPVLEVRPRRDALARYGLAVGDVNDVVSVALAGREVGQWIEGDRHLDIVLRLSDVERTDLNVLRNLPVPAAATGLRLSDVADITFTQMPPTLLRRMGSRYVVVESYVNGRDLGGFVGDVQARIRHDVKLPPGYSIDYGGQFETYLAARNRLAIVVPIALSLILLLLFSAFQSLRQALLVFTGVPLAVTGGVMALFLRGLPFSISAGVGFIALSGVAVLNGVVMVSRFNSLRDEGASAHDAAYEGALERLRPVLMTALVASLGFVPMAIAHGTGAEVQRPLATVVIGGLISSTLLTLLVLPVLYSRFERDGKKA